MRLLSLLGLDRRLRRLRIAAAEGAMAAEDRVQLLRMAWEEEKQRLKLVLVLAIVLLGLTTIAVALLSVAVVVHFWDTPQRTTAAWSVAALWIVLWLAAAWGLWTQLRGASNSFTPTREELARDWTWVQERFGAWRRGRRRGRGGAAPSGHARGTDRAHRAPAPAHRDLAGWRHRRRARRGAAGTAAARRNAYRHGVAHRARASGGHGRCRCCGAGGGSPEAPAALGDLRRADPLAHALKRPASRARPPSH
ncbi:phage holin family protein [Variovorax sp. UC122_21]|uniref:phage holin family protein n=1 Tax=Variovorax sp. UC122_21 TaxID=3374554 RepID=UPI003756DBFD